MPGWLLMLFFGSSCLASADGLLERLLSKNLLTREKASRFYRGRRGAQCETQQSVVRRQILGGLMVEVGLMTDDELQESSFSHAKTFDLNFTSPLSVLGWEIRGRRGQMFGPLGKRRGFVDSYVVTYVTPSKQVINLEDPQTRRQVFMSKGNLADPDIGTTVRLLKPVLTTSLCIEPEFWSGIPYVEVALFICANSQDPIKFQEESLSGALTETGVNRDMGPTDSRTVSQDTDNLPQFSSGALTEIGVNRDMGPSDTRAVSQNAGNLLESLSGALTETGVNRDMGPTDTRAVSQDVDNLPKSLSGAMTETGVNRDMGPTDTRAALQNTDNMPQSLPGTLTENGVNRDMGPTDTRAVSQDADNLPQSVSGALTETGVNRDMGPTDTRAVSQDAGNLPQSLSGALTETGVSRDMGLTDTRAVSQNADNLPQSVSGALTETGVNRDMGPTDTRAVSEDAGNLLQSLSETGVKKDVGPTDTRVVSQNADNLPQSLPGTLTETGVNRDMGPTDTRAVSQDAGNLPRYTNTIETEQKMTPSSNQKRAEDGNNDRGGWEQSWEMFSDQGKTEAKKTTEKGE